MLNDIIKCINNKIEVNSLLDAPKLLGDSVYDWVWFQVNADFNFPIYRNLRQANETIKRVDDDLGHISLNKGDVFGLSFFSYTWCPDLDTRYSVPTRKSSIQSKTNIIKFNNNPYIAMFSTDFIEGNDRIFVDVTKQIIRNFKIEKIIK